MVTPTGFRKVCIYWTVIYTLNKCNESLSYSSIAFGSIYPMFSDLSIGKYYQVNNPLDNSMGFW